MGVSLACFLPTVFQASFEMMCSLNIFCIISRVISAVFCLSLEDADCRKWSVGFKTVHLVDNFCLESRAVVLGVSSGVSILIPSSVFGCFLPPFTPLAGAELKQDKLH